MKLAVLGTGCRKCQQLAAVVEQAAQQLGGEYELVKVTDLQQIMGYGVMATPALVVDGQVRLTGKVPSLAEATKLLTGA